MPFLALEDGKLFYEISGKGRWLVLIHGAWASHEWWRWQVPVLSRDYRVLTLDVRGHGQSSPLQTSCSIERFTRDLEIIFQKLGIEEMSLVGWSMGGMISLQFCLNLPRKVKALVLIATRGHRCPKTKRRIRLQHLKARFSLFMDLSAPRKYDREAETFPGEKDRAEAEVRRMLGIESPKEVFEWVVADLNHNPRRHYFEIAKSFWDWEAGQNLGKITAPTLILAGEKDDWVPPFFSRLLQEQIPGSRLVIVEGAGHCLPLERPERINFELSHFLHSLNYL